MSMTQVMDMMRTLQENVAASRSEQERMHEALVASQARNEELNRVNEELRKALQEREERAVGDRSAPPSPLRSFPMPFSQEIMDSVVPTNTVAVKVCCPDPLVSRLSGVTPPRLLKSGDVSWLTSPLKAKSPRKGETWPQLSRPPRRWSSRRG